MDLKSKQLWFTAQSQPYKMFFMLELLYQLTIALRGISLAEDTALKWQAAWEASECHHRVLEYVRAVMSRSPDNYPDDVIVEIVDYKLRHAALQPFAQTVWDSAVDNASRFGAHLVG